MKKRDILQIAKKKFKSRLIVGTGKYKNINECSVSFRAWPPDIQEDERGGKGAL